MNKVCVVVVSLMCIFDVYGLSLKCKFSQEVRINQPEGFTRLAVLPNYLLFDYRAIIKPDIKRNMVLVYSSEDKSDRGFTEIILAKDSTHTRSMLESESSLEAKAFCDGVKFELRSDNKANIYLVAENQDYFMFHLAQDHSSWQSVFSNYVTLSSE